MNEPSNQGFLDDEPALGNTGLASKNAHLGDSTFPQKHTAANIADHLMNARTDFGVWSRNAKGRIHKSEESLRCHKLACFGMEPPLDRPVLTSDCGSDVSVGAKKDNLWDWNHFTCHCMNIAVQSALRCPTIQKFVEPLVKFACKLSRSRSLWMEFKKVHLEMLHWESECSDDKGDAGFDGDEGLSYAADSKPRQVKRVLKLLTLVSTHWNSMYYLIKRALVLKDPLTKFTDHVQSTFLGETPPPHKSPTNNIYDAPL